MLRTLTCLFIAWTCLALGACGSVTTTHLLGEPVDDAQAAGFEGAWTGGDSLFLARSLGEGKLQVATTKWNEEEQKFELEQDTLFVRSVGDAIVLQVLEQREEGPDAAARYALARLVLTDTGEIIFLPADVKKFGEAVERGELDGEAQSDHAEGELENFMASDARNVRLTGSKEEIDAYLTAVRLPLLFTLEGSGVMRRIESVEVK